LRDEGLECRIGFRVVGCKVWGVGVRVQCLGLWGWGLALRVSGFGFCFVLVSWIRVKG
jgi:hypothetical protein